MKPRQDDLDEHWREERLRERDLEREPPRWPVRGRRFPFRAAIRLLPTTTDGDK